VKNNYPATCTSIECNSINIEIPNVIIEVGLLALLESLLPISKQFSVKLYSVQNFIIYKFCKPF
jgi:hypothetical protein